LYSPLTVAKRAVKIQFFFILHTKGLPLSALPVNFEMRPTGAHFSCCGPCTVFAPGLGVAHTLVFRASHRIKIP